MLNIPAGLSYLFDYEKNKTPLIIYLVITPYKIKTVIVKTKDIVN